METSSKRLIEFYGRECSHCLKMVPVVAAVEKKSGKYITKMEVWHDEQNQQHMQTYAHALRFACGGVLGVPAFYNEETGEALCGEQDEDTLLAWVLNKPSLTA